MSGMRRKKEGIGRLNNNILTNNDICCSYNTCSASSYDVCIRNKMSLPKVNIGKIISIFIIIVGLIIFTFGMFQGLYFTYPDDFSQYIILTETGIRIFIIAGVILPTIGILLYHYTS